MRAPSAAARALVAILALLLPACAADGRWFPAAPTPPSQDLPEDDRAAVMLAVEDFLDALAGSAGAGPLRKTVRGPLLQDWAGWLARAGSGASGPGTVEIRALRVVWVQDDVARADLDATVTFEAAGADAREVAFVGPVALARDADAAAGWAVSDLVREERPMSLAITVFQPPALGAEGGVEVEVRSLYRFATGTVANVRIRNATTGAVRMDRSPTLVQAAGRFIPATGASGPLLERVAAGASSEGWVEFHPFPLRWLPENVMLHLVDGTVVSVELPVEAFIPPTAEA